MGFGSVPVLVRAFLPSAHSPLVGAVVALGTGALVQTSVTWAVRRGQAWWHGRGALRALGSYALSGALSGSANTTNYVAVSFLGAAETSALTSAAPLVTLLASRLLRGLREPLTPVLYLAGVLVVLGGALVALATPGNAPLGSG
jgi:drug/metabolite transporter (DMT)-like permease